LLGEIPVLENFKKSRSWKIWRKNGRMKTTTSITDPSFALPRQLSAKGSPRLSTSTNHRVRLATASLVGTTLEYYDFAVYNTLAALVFNRLFFPAFDPLSGTILALSTFAVGYAARPIGGVICGNLGERFGRRFVLVTTLLVIGTTTVMIGLLPTYEYAGTLAPILLVVLRFVQGAALGGEWAGAVLLCVEHGSDTQRGRNGAWTQVGPSLGTLIATGLLAWITGVLSPEEFQTWGWRLPFLASGFLVIFGFWIRRGIGETPVYEELRRSQLTSQAPISEVLKLHWRGVLRVIGARLGPDVWYSLIVVFSLSYLATVLGVPKPLALISLSIGLVFNVFTEVFFGALSDRLGRRTVYGAGVILSVIWVFAFFALLDTREPLLITVAIVVGLVAHAIMYGPQAAFITEQFPTRVQFAGSSMAYTLAGIVGGGIAPAIFATLFRAFKTPFSIVLYTAGALTITGIVLLFSRKSTHAPRALSKD
jgi:MFS family permease